MLLIFKYAIICNGHRYPDALGEGGFGGEVARHRPKGLNPYEILKVGPVLYIGFSHKDFI